MSQTGILLESGTNELEIVEFNIDKNIFGINVAKVREIIKPKKVTITPESSDSVIGIFELRDTVMPLIDLADYLGFNKLKNINDGYIIIAEFNKNFFGFLVAAVDRIHRISWERVEKPPRIFENAESNITGVIMMDKKIVQLLDFEKIVADINPAVGIKQSDIEAVKGLREKFDKTTRKIYFAEDSGYLRKLIVKSVENAGYIGIKEFANGKELLDALKEAGGEAHLIITDIEMPVMDGHHLLKTVKTDKNFMNIPVILFSSLINDEIFAKGRELGADAQITKPDIPNLAKVIDELVIKE